KTLGLDQKGKATDDMLKSADELASTPELKLRAAIIAGEMKGGEEALRRLRQIEASDAPKDVIEDARALEKVYAKDGGALDERQRQRLRERYPYFSRLAFSYGKPKDAEPRKSLEDDAKSVTIMFVGAVLVM